MAIDNELDEQEVIETTSDVEESDENEDSEVEFDDTNESTTVEESSTENKKQSKEDNHKYAEMRRAQREKELKDAHSKGVIEGLGGINPYTKEKIEDDDDLELYQEMKEIEKRGGDPVDDYHKYKKIFKQERLQKEQQAQQAELNRKKSLQEDFDNFKKEYPDVNEVELLQDKKFNLFAKSSIENGESLSSAYKRFLEFNSLINNEIDNKARKQAAKKYSSPGSMNKDADVVEKSYGKMSDDEFKEMQRKLGFRTN